MLTSLLNDVLELGFDLGRENVHGVRVIVPILEHPFVLVLVQATIRAEMLRENEGWWLLFESFFQVVSFLYVVDLLAFAKLLLQFDSLGFFVF